MLALCMYRQVEGVLEVAAGAVKGASTVYMSLESAAATLATSITQNTVKVVTHKYDFPFMLYSRKAKYSSFNSSVSFFLSYFLKDIFYYFFPFPFLFPFPCFLFSFLSVIFGTSFCLFIDLLWFPIPSILLVKQNLFM